MNKKLVILSLFLFHLKERREEDKEKEWEKLVFNQLFIVQNKSLNMDNADYI